MLFRYVFVPKRVILSSGEAEVLRAIRNPIGTERISDIIKPGEKIAIIASNITRPFPTSIVLPVLLEELLSAGIAKQDITVVFALGIHRNHTIQEFEKLAGSEIVKEINCVDSNPNDIITMGVTSGGTPVEITRRVAEADRRICLGNIEYHYFAGYSGGAKAIMPGVSTRRAIQSNHSKMIQPEAIAGRLEGNPVREDIEEAGRICPIDFIVNVVLDAHKKIIFAVAGDFIKAHRRGCDFLDKLYLKNIKSRTDIVIVSQGGAPKDLNLYQPQKALDDALEKLGKDASIIVMPYGGSTLPRVI